MASLFKPVLVNNKDNFDTVEKKRWSVYYNS